MALEKLLPQNIEAEMGVLGSILIDPEALDRVIGFLRPGDFYRDAHRTIYETILLLAQQRTEADFITLCDALETRNKLDGVGGPTYVTSLINGVPTSGNLLYYARIVERTGVLRRLIQVAGEIAALGYEETDVPTALEKAEKLIFEVSQPYLLAQSTDIGMSELMTRYLDIVADRYENRGRIVGVPTGYTDLDRMLGGLQKSDLDILAARTSVGKTMFSVNIAYNAALKYKRNVGIFSLEMSKEQLAQRFLAVDSQVEQSRLRTGMMEDDDWDAIVAAVGRLAELGIRIDDTGGISLLQMKSRARRWIAEYGIELIIVDYLQLVTTGDTRKFANREAEVSTISRELKTLARELNVPILALAQLSRALETRQSKVPQLSDLRESGGIENDADVVMFIYRDEVYNPETERPKQADIIVAKHRNGATGQAVLYFDQAKSRFENLDMVTMPDEEVIVFPMDGYEEEREERSYPTEDEDEESGEDE